MTTFAPIVSAVLAGNVKEVIDYVAQTLQGDGAATDGLGDTLLHVAARHNGTNAVRAVEEALICVCKVPYDIPNANGITSSSMPDLGSPPDINVKRYLFIKLNCTLVANPLANPNPPVQKI
ncbi:MAG: hypothetical protein V4455_07910 [Pseudomonadota bacterium]